MESHLYMYLKRLETAAGGIVWSKYFAIFHILFINPFRPIHIRCFLHCFAHFARNIVFFALFLFSVHLIVCRRVCILFTFTVHHDIHHHCAQFISVHVHVGFGSWKYFANSVLTEQKAHCTTFVCEGNVRDADAHHTAYTYASAERDFKWRSSQSKIDARAQIDFFALFIPLNLHRTLFRPFIFCDVGVFFLIRNGQQKLQ